MTKNDKAELCAICDEVPWSEGITDYDRAHFITYVRLLDAVEDRATEDEICRVILGIDAVQEPERAKRVFELHLRRARWMTEQGYKHLVE